MQCRFPETPFFLQIINFLSASKNIQNDLRRHETSPPIMTGHRRMKIYIQQWILKAFEKKVCDQFQIRKGAENEKFQF